MHTQYMRPAATHQMVIANAKVIPGRFEVFRKVNASGQLARGWIENQTTRTGAEVDRVLDRDQLRYCREACRRAPLSMFCIADSIPGSIMGRGFSAERRLDLP